MQFQNICTVHRATCKSNGFQVKRLLFPRVTLFITTWTPWNKLISLVMVQGFVVCCCYLFVCKVKYQPFVGVCRVDTMIFSWMSHPKISGQQVQMSGFRVCCFPWGTLMASSPFQYGSIDGLLGIEHTLLVCNST